MIFRTFSNTLLACLLVIVDDGVQAAMYHPRSAKTHARAYDGFQYLEPALIPIGTYIALEGIPTVFNFSSYPAGSGGSGTSIPELVNDIIESEIGDAEENAMEKSARRSAGQPQEPIKGLAGIRFLSSTRLPMGIFIPDRYMSNLTSNGPDGSNSPTPSSANSTKDPTQDEITIKKTARMRIFRGVRHIVGKLTRASRQSPAQFDYNTTFNGLTPFEAVYMPHGIFVPLSAIPGRRSANDNIPNTNTFFEGIAPLNVLAMTPGIFVAHRLSGLPALPPNVIPVPPSDQTTSIPEDANEDTDYLGTDGPSQPDGPSQSNGSSQPNGPTPASNVGGTTSRIPDTEVEKLFMRFVNEEYNTVAETLQSQHANAVWQFETNVTDFNEAAMILTQGALAKFIYTVGQGIRSYRPEAIKDPKFMRIYRKLSNSGEGVLGATKQIELNKVRADMERVYSAGAICGDVAVSVADIANCPKELKWSLSPNITQHLATSRNATLLLHIWKSWRDATGKKIKPYYLRYLQLKNESAKADGYSDMGLEWREPYIEPDYKYSDIDFTLEMKELLNKTLPLYIHLHAYVRRKLIAKYPDAKIDPKGAIPAHLLGSSWSYNWKNLLDFTWPYPRKPLTDATKEMVKQNWTVEQMFRTTDKFITDLGLIPMPQEFWNKSVFVKPKDRPVMCQPEAIDFYNHKDFRIKMCGDVTIDDLVTIHHEMGNLEYSLQYQNQFVAFREGANPGFMEAIGSALALSVTTPSHLRRLKLASPQTTFGQDMFRDTNFLYSTALDKVAHLPFAYLVDKYRYDVFSGKIPLDQLNAKWSQAVTKNQGICAPVVRTEDDFDAGSKYHIPADVPYARYFVASILQFQFHKALCNAAGHRGALYECDIDGSEPAGKMLQEVMALGSSVPWQVAMEKLTGSPRMDAGPLLEYFEPLYNWLEEENERSGTPLGWEGADSTCPQNAL